MSTKESKELMGGDDCDGKLGNEMFDMKFIE